MKKSASILAAFLLVITASAQKPKDTFDHEKFAKKFNLNLSYDVMGMFPRDPDLQYISTATGQSLLDLQTQNVANKTTFKEDVDNYNKQKVLRILDKTEVKILQETPIKKADIILYCHYKDKSYTLTLTNCIQTNTSWFPGDHLVAAGAGFEGLIADKQAKDAKMNNSFFGKMAAAEREQQKKDSAARVAALKEQRKNDSIAKVIGRPANIYKATPFAMQNGDASTQYIHFELVDRALKGYYITKAGEKVDAFIHYEAPEKLTLHGWNMAICQAANDAPVVLYYEGIPNFLKSLKKEEIKAFYVGDQLWVQTGADRWDILLAEGAIRKLVRLTKVTNAGKTTYMTTQFIQKMNETPVNAGSIALTFKSSMSELVKDNVELATKIKNKESGYTFGNIEKIIVDYNLWFDKTYPGKAGYMF